MQSEAEQKLAEAMKVLNEERTKLHAMQTRNKKIDVDELLKKKADELKLFELKETVLEERQRYSEAVEDASTKMKYRIR